MYMCTIFFHAWVVWVPELWRSASAKLLGLQIGYDASSIEDKATAGPKAIPRA
jgi:hypothetical protein